MSSSIYVPKSLHGAYQYQQFQIQNEELDAHEEAVAAAKRAASPAALDNRPATRALGRKRDWGLRENPQFKAMVAVSSKGAVKLSAPATETPPLLARALAPGNMVQTSISTSSLSSGSAKGVLPGERTVFEKSKDKASGNTFKDLTKEERAHRQQQLRKGLMRAIARWEQQEQQQPKDFHLTTPAPLPLVGFA